MTALRSIAPRLRDARRRVLRHRRGLAALAAGGAVLFGLQAAAPEPPDTVAAWAATRNLPSGALVTPSDLELRRLAPEDLPADRVTRPEQVVGRTLAAPVSRGEVLTTSRAMTAGLLRGYPGRTAVPVRISDPDVVGLLRVGDRVSLVAAGHEAHREPALIADDVPVVAIPTSQQEAFEAGSQGRLVVFAVPTAQAAGVAAAAVADFVTVLWAG